jgi:hypothetical protein
LAKTERALVRRCLSFRSWKHCRERCGRREGYDKEERVEPWSGGIGAVFREVLLKKEEEEGDGEARDAIAAATVEPFPASSILLAVQRKMLLSKLQLNY